ncbi:MAG: aspartyl-tRNA(Asn)/glutamyl-tRNA(Gln) amidotransferase subunit C [Glaciecola sp.]
MALSEDQVRHVAMLARLALTDDEVHDLAPQLSKILDYAAQVGEVAAGEVEPTVHPYPLQNVFRADEPGEPLDREELLSQGPEVDQDRFVVPRIVAQES